MIMNIINKISFFTFFLGISLGDSENLLIPTSIILISIIIFSITNDDFGD